MKYLLLIFLFLLATLIIFQYVQYKQLANTSCDGDWSYNVKCPLGTYCKSLNQGPLAGGSCQPYLYPLFNIFPSKKFSPPNACIQVITSAINPQTNECRDFPTPCDVPEGWEKVDSC